MVQYLHISTVLDPTCFFVLLLSVRTYSTIVRVEYL